MASWSVTSISATPDFACVNDESPPAITLPRKQIIWDQLDINDYIDDSYEGSKRPVVFRTTQAYIFGAPQVPTEVTGTVKVPTAIEVTGTANFPESWEGATYTVSALLGDVKVLESEKIRVVPGSSEVSAKNFSLLLSNPAAAAEIPFRLSGDFSWLIELVDNPDSSETRCPAENPTRLELCWARSAAPNGNPTPTKPDVTRVNLGGIYPIVLLRLFSPNPTEFLGEPPDSILRWYINRAMKAIWDWPNSDDDISPQYDVTEGKSGFDMLYSGGTFPLRKWVKKQYYKVNCYDLAAVSQLACAILVDEEGNELLGSRWVCQIPNGFINPGPLFGWNKVEDGKNHMMCNNPLWRNGSYCSMPDAPQQCLGRSSFSMHVWVEINGAQVLDACHASTENPHPDTGTRSREVYLMETIDQNRDPRTRGNAENYMENGNAEGSCRINPYAQTARLGVIGISGYDPGVKGATGSSVLTSKQGYLGMSDSPMLKKARSPLTKPPAKARPPPTNTRSPFSRPIAPIDVSTDHPVMDLPEDFRRYIEDTLERGRSSKPPVKTINRARVNPETLIPLLAPETTPQKPQTSLSIRPDVTEIQITFDCTRENLKAIHLALDVFNSYETAIDGLTRHLLTFSNFESLSLIVKPLDQTIGHFCYKTSDSIFWIHGNLLIRIHESKNDPFAPAGDPAIFEMATKLDNHLDSTANHPTSPPEFDLPRPIDRSGSPPKFIAPIDSPIDNPHEPPPNSGVPDNKVQVLHVRSGETFTAQVAGKASFLPTREASCRDTNIILPVGPTKEGDFEFYAVEPGKTEVSICVADAETLSPTELKYEIFVDHNSD